MLRQCIANVLAMFCDAQVTSSAEHGRFSVPPRHRMHARRQQESDLVVHLETRDDNFRCHPKNMADDDP